MTHVERLEIKNWYRFEGEHTIELGPQVYGVVAEHEDDTERSNWLGKSALLASIAFVLTGKWRLWSEDRTLADEWITRGQQQGGVAAKLSDGLLVRRTRKRGASTQLEVIEPGREVATGDEAQAIIDAHLGGADLGAWYFQQGTIADYVNQQPAGRMAVISEWAGLEELRRAHKLAGERCSDAKTELANAEHRLQVASDQLRAIAGRWFELEPSDSLAGLPGALQELLTDAEASVALAEEKGRQAADKTEQAAVWEAVEADRARVVELRQWLSANQPTPKAEVRKAEQEVKDATQTVQEASEAEGVARRDREQASRLACGQFDGKCPVDGHACPDKDEMNAKRADNEARLAQARAEEQRLREVRMKAEQRHHEARKAQHRLNAHDEEVVRRRVQLEELEDKLSRVQAAEHVDLATARKCRDEASTALADAKSLMHRVREDMQQATSLLSQVGDLESVVKQFQAEVAVRRQAVLVMGREGAQRRVAEGVLSQIDALANDALARVGADLRVSQTWGHPTKDPEEQCHRCGEPYQGKRPKQCPACGAERGRKWVEQPEVQLSRVSGAARDLAGVAIRLAAGAWLRQARGSHWSCALVDEAFGALDAHHRRALAAAMASLLGGQYGYEQALVVAHSRDVLEALPGRILVRGIGDRSTVEVVA